MKKDAPPTDTLFTIGSRDEPAYLYGCSGSNENVFILLLVNRLSVFCPALCQQALQCLVKKHCAWVLFLVQFIL